MHKFLLIALLSGVFFLTGCLPPATPYIDFNTTEPLDAENIQPRNGDERPLRIAIATVMSPQVTVESYRNIANYISKKLNRPTVLVQRQTYEEVNMLMSNGDADIAFASTGAYSSYKGLTPTEILAMVVHNQTSYYHVQVIVHKNSNFHTIDDLQGKSFAFTDPLSYSGHISIIEMLYERGLRPEQYFGRYIYTYSHDKSIWAVANKVVDAASIDSMIYDYLKVYHPELTDQIRVIKTIGPFPTGPVIIRSTMSSDQKEAIRNIFLTMHLNEEIQPSLNNLLIDYFIMPDPKNYELLQKTYEQFDGGTR